MPLSEIDGSFLSPNHNERAESIYALVLHYTAIRSARASVRVLCDGDAPARVSAHYVVSEEGAIYRLVEEERRAWHAGVSYWRSIHDINSCSVGIEVVNPGYESGVGYHAFSRKQMEAVRELSADIVERHGIAAAWILGHSDVSIGRKIDPGDLFDWRYLAEGGVGFFPSPPADEALRSERGEEIEARLHSLLETMGYDGSAERRGRARIMAFQRRWRAARVDGVADGECVAVAEAVLRGWGEL